MRILIGCLVLLAVPTQLQAQENRPLFRATLVTAIAAHGADLASTEHCIGSGRCREMNPFLLRFDQPAVFGSVKMGIAALGLLGSLKLYESGHNRLAISLNLAQTAAFFIIAAHNSQQGKP